MLHRILCNRSAGLVTLILAIFSCKTTNIVPAPASLTIVHAITGSKPVLPKLGDDEPGKYYTDISELGYGSARLYSTIAGNLPISIVPVTDTNLMVYSGHLVLRSGAIYSFFLAGDTTHVDTLLVKDEIPFYSDSSAGLRCINLLSGVKTSIRINLQGDSANAQFSNITYADITAFKKFNATSAVGTSYSLEIRDQQTGNLLSTFTWSFTPQKNNTLVVSGSTDLAVGLTVFTINNY